MAACSTLRSVLQCGAATEEDLLVSKPIHKDRISEGAIREDFSRTLKIAKQATLLEERTRIARELHDTLLQTFLSASMQLGSALDSLPSDSPVKTRFDRIRQLMDLGIEEGRNTIQGLRSTGSDAVDLVLALSLAVQQEHTFHPEIDFRVMVAGRQRPLLAPVGHEVYRIGREALVNAFRHSGANQVELKLEYARTNLRMFVRDNGCGIDPGVLHADREGHWGLLGMRERAARIHGLLKISSYAGNGTKVQLSVPRRLPWPNKSAKVNSQEQQ